MAYKRSRNQFEADLTAQQSPYVFYGTPLPPLDPSVRDDGSYVPVWKQEVTDERGRKRLHGAFTGGFSAGYFNTVGSKEGWTPSTFVSSKLNRRKDESTQARPEDFMDEEDLADAAEKQVLQTQEGFAGIGSTGQDELYKGSIMDLFRPHEDTAGVKLLKKMGWREGQGIGARNKARDGTDLDAPTNSNMIRFARKDDRKGLGFQAEGRLDGAATNSSQSMPATSKTVETSAPAATQKASQRRGGFGVGVLNDDSDNDDAYNMGPRISYTKTISNKKIKTPSAKTKTTIGPANPLLKSKPVFLSKKLLQNRPSLRKCHDARLPLDGFVLCSASATAMISTVTGLDDANPNPKAPQDWSTTKSPTTTTTTTSTQAPYQSTSDAAKTSSLDPKARAALLGEAQLPGKSVFDFLTPAARERLASSSGNTALPVARGERAPTSVKSNPAASSLDKQNESTTSSSQAVHIPKDTALAALGRGIGGWMPYSDDEPKRARYRSVLQHYGGLSPVAPSKPASMSREDWERELDEFARAAEVFKPMSGAMASRFTSASHSADASGNKQRGDDEGESPETEEEKAEGRRGTAEDPAEAAARMGMYGPMTRSVQTFYPSRLLCKRFNVRPPAHVEAAGDASASASTSASMPGTSAPTAAQQGSSGRSMQFTPSETMMPQRDAVSMSERANVEARAATGTHQAQGGQQKAIEGHSYVNVEQNDALEGKKAGEDVFRAVFGSDDEDDE